MKIKEIMTLMSDEVKNAKTEIKDSFKGINTYIKVWAICALASLSLFSIGYAANPDMITASPYAVKAVVNEANSQDVNALINSIDDDVIEAMFADKQSYTPSKFLEEAARRDPNFHKALMDYYNIDNPVKAFKALVKGDCIDMQEFLFNKK